MKVIEATNEMLDTFVPLDNDASMDYVKSEVIKGSDCYVMDNNGQKAIMLMRPKTDLELELYCFVNVNGKSLNLTNKVVDVVEEIARNKGFEIVMFSTTRSPLIKLATEKHGYSVHEVILKKKI